MKFYRQKRKTYFIFFCLLLMIEIGIAAWVNDDFVRPYLGDFLVVILIYCFLMTISRLKVVPALLAVLIFSFGVEFFQMLNIVKLLQYQPPKIVMIAIGSDFSVWDLVAYSLGILFTGLLELKFNSQNESAAN